MSTVGSPKKKLMDRILSGMSPGRRRASTSQFNIEAALQSCDLLSDDSSSVLSRQSSLRSDFTSVVYDLQRPEDSDELDRLFLRVLNESNLEGNERMMAMRADDKWKLIQAHAKAEQQNCNPMIVIDKMTQILMRLDGSMNSKEAMIKYLDKTTLDSLTVSFRTASISWLRTFVENGGCELMVQIMKTVYQERNICCQHVSWLIGAVKSFSNCPFGVECFIEREGLLETLLLFIDCPDFRVKQCIVHILTAVVYMNSEVGIERILEAYSCVQRVLGEEDRFDTLLAVLSKECQLARRGTDKRSQSIKFIVIKYSLSFI